MFTLSLVFNLYTCFTPFSFFYFVALLNYVLTEEAALSYKIIFNNHTVKYDNIYYESNSINE